MNSYRYFKWNGTVPFQLDRDKLIDEFTQRLMSNGDVSEILWDMQRNTLRDSQGRRFSSLDQILERVQHQKQIHLSRYNLDTVMDDIRKALDDIINTEREGIWKYLQEVKQRAQTVSQGLPAEIQQKLLKSVEETTTRNLRKLDELPSDIGGRVQSLNHYDFVDQSAKKKFQELLELLKKRTLDTFAREMARTIRNINRETLDQFREMVKGLNKILDQRNRGERPDFEDFMQRFGQFFGPDSPRNLDDLVERLQDQVAQAQSLLNSLSEDRKQSLEQLFKSMLDQETQYELAKLGANLRYLNQGNNTREQYSFYGDEQISYDEALKLMETLQKIDRLEDQVKESRFRHSLDSIDSRTMREVLDDETANELETMRNISRILEESGYIRKEKRDYELTPHGIRKIGEKALSTVFSRLKIDRVGGHRTPRQGGGGERLYETKYYEFGDDFDVHIEKTIMNALQRESRVPVRLDVRDFEVYKEEQSTRSATVLLLDLSLSMHMHGNFQAAKIVAIALDALISSRYPRDSLYVVGFSSYARRLTREDLNHVNWDNLDPYTNMQHGFILSRKLLSRDASANKQILLITDGEPTAHFENTRVFFQYPPSMRTIRLTLKEVSNCTRGGIVINAFMLKTGGLPDSFMNQIARINRGRVFATTADKLGEYLIVDYLSNKKKTRIA
jgi:uncharacterized protein with von Willebrand factor type A (vWA) domain